MGGYRRNEQQETLIFILCSSPFLLSFSLIVFLFHYLCSFSLSCCSFLLSTHTSPINHYYRATLLQFCDLRRSTDRNVSLNSIVDTTKKFNINFANCQLCIGVAFWKYPFCSCVMLIGIVTKRIQCYFSNTYNKPYTTLSRLVVTFWPENRALIKFYKSTCRLIRLDKLLYKAWKAIL